MLKEVGFNKEELKIFAFLADDKGHALWEMQDALKIDKGYLSKVLKELNTKGLIYKKERSLIRPGKRGPKIEYPWYIQKDKTLDIAKTVLYQIKHYLSKSTAASNELEILKTEGRLTQPLEDELVGELLCYSVEADETMELFKIPLFRDHAARMYLIDCITHEGLRDLIYSEFGLALGPTLRSHSDELKYEEEKKLMNPEYFYKKFSSNLEQSIKTESERKALEANTDAVLKIKELWNNGYQNWKIISEAIGQPPNVVIAQISKMLDCNEIILTECETGK